MVIVRYALWALAAAIAYVGWNVIRKRELPTVLDTAVGVVLVVVILACLDEFVF